MHRSREETEKGTHFKGNNIELHTHTEPRVMNKTTVVSGVRDHKTKSTPRLGIRSIRWSDLTTRCMLVKVYVGYIRGKLKYSKIVFQQNWAMIKRFGKQTTFERLTKISRILDNVRKRKCLIFEESKSEHCNEHQQWPHGTHRSLSLES